MKIFAAGADIKNRFLLAGGGKVYPGPDTADLSQAVNYERFKRNAALLAKKTGIRPEVVVCDLHPGYLSVKFTKQKQPWFAGGYRLIQVQHHHAHVASVIQEYRLRGPVIGVSFDGTGYGTDGNIWGGEFFFLEGADFQRLAHFKYRMMPGGDKAVSEPWRMVLSILKEKGAVLMGRVGRRERELVLTMINRGINSPLTSSAGRLFDTAAALLGLCIYASHEAEGPVKLESISEEKEKGSYDFEILSGGDADIIDTEGVFLGMIRDLGRGKPGSVIAARFHNSMVRVIVKVAGRLSKRFGVRNVALSGGVFQNNFLKERVIKGLTAAGFRVLVNSAVPVNDLNIALGQYYLACCSRE